MDNHDDTTTTEYDSGGSEGVDYVYEGQQVITQASIESGRKRKDKSPKRKTSPKGKRRATPTRCTCGGGRKDSDSESTASCDDTEDEDGTEKRLSGPTKPRPSGPENGNEGPCCGEKEHTCCRKKAAKKTGKRTPYIEEYPDEIRPMVLLKEHKLPRRSSVSDPKRIRPEEHQMSSSLGKIQSMGKRPPWVSTHQSMRPPEEPNSEQPATSRRHRNIRPEVPGGRFSSSDLDDSDSEAGDPEPSMPRRSRHEQIGGVEMASAAARSSAWNHSSSPKYSSSWPLQHGSHYPQRSVARHHQPEHGGYESGDESDDIFDGEFEFDETTHRRRPKRAFSPPNHHHQVQQRQFQEQEHQIQHPQVQRPQAQYSQAQHPQAQHPQAQHPQAQHPQHQQPQPQEPQEPQEPQDEPRMGRPRRVRPPRPPVARTVVSRRSMATMDQGYNRASTATNLCDIWRGRPEDWESPYSSSESEADDQYEQPMMLLEGTPPRRSSPQLLPPRRSMDMRFAMRNNSPSREPSPMPFPRRSNAWDAADERYLLMELPAPSVRGGNGRSRRGARRAPSRAPTERSRWTMMAPDYGFEHDPYESEFEPAPLYHDTGYHDTGYHDTGYHDTGYYSYGFAPVVQAPSPPFTRGGRGATSPPPMGRRNRDPPPMAFTADEEYEYGYEARRSRELLSPVPSRTAAARFDFDKSYSELSRLLM